MKTKLLIVILTVCLGITIHAQNIPKYGIFETSFTHTGTISNPYKDGNATVTFTAPDGAKSTIPMFWYGGTNWKVRFSPNKTGSWSYTTNSSNEGLNSKSGTFNCVSSSNKGGIGKKSDAPYHFETENGDPFYWMGDTEWSFFGGNASENHLTADVKHYLDVRSAQNFNVVHGVLIHPKGWGNEQGDAFTNMGSEVLNANYFKVCDERVAYANSKGITIGIMLAWKSDNLDWQDFPSAAARERFCKYAAARYSAYNVYFIVAGEYNEGTSGYDWDQMANAVKNNDPHNRMIAMHATGSTETFASKNWCSFGDYKQTYTNLHSTMLDARDHNKPVVNSEYAYYKRDQNGDGVCDKPNSCSLNDIRNATWDLVMAGGYVVSGFGTTYFGGVRDSGPFDVDASKNNDFEEDISYVRPFFETLDYWKLQPKDALLSGSGTRYCLYDKGNTYVAYVRGNSGTNSLSLDGAASKTYKVKLFNPRTGTTTSLSDYTGVGPITLNNPDNNDYVYVLESGSTCSNAAPTASISANKSTVKTGEQVSFTVSAGDSDGSIASYVWSWGNNTTNGSGSPANSNHSWSATGTYKVSLSVTDNHSTCPKTTVSNEVSVQVVGNYPPVISSATVTPNTGNAPLDVVFSAEATDAEGDALTYEWDFDGDGKYDATGKTANYTYTNSGHFDPVLRVKDANGSVTQQLTLDVEPEALKVIALADKSSGNAPLVVNFLAETNGGSPSGGDFAEQAGTVVIEAENYTALTKNGDATDWVVANSLSDFAGSGYVATPNNGLAKGNWGAACEVSYDILFSTAGTYNVWAYRYSADGASNSAHVGLDGVNFGTTDNGAQGSWGWYNFGSVSITKGDHTFSIQRREDGYCVDKIILTTSSTAPTGNAQSETTGGGGDYIYSWDFKDGNTSNQQNPTHTFVANGTFEVLVTATDGKATATDLVSITVTGGADTYDLTVNNGAGTGKYIEGATVTIQADDAPEGKVFDKWTGDVATVQSATNANTSLTMPAKAISVSATYKDVPSYTVSITVKDGTTPISGATVTLENASVNTNASGIATFKNIVNGLGYAYTVDKTGYNSASGTVDVNNANASETVSITVASGGGSGVIFDEDLTDNTLDYGVKTGGEWDNGWKVKANGEQIVWDAGYPIKTGYIEATFTLDQDPTAFGSKINYLSGYEAASLNHSENNDKLYVRTGQAKYAFSRFKARGANFNTTELEHNVGSSGDWKFDGTTVHKVRISWHDNVSVLASVGGKENVNYTAPMSATDFDVNPVDEIRYGVVGSSNYAQALIGMKVLTFKMVDLGGGAPTKYSGVVTVLNGSSPVAGASVNYNGQTIYSGADGKAIFNNLMDGTSGSVTVSAEGYDTKTGSMAISSADGAVSISLSESILYTLSVSNGTGSGLYAAGTKVTVEADTPPTGLVFDKWTGDTESLSSITPAAAEFTMPTKAATITATYKIPLKPTHKLTVVNGSGSGDYEEGTVVSIIADAPAEGKLFDSWTGDVSSLVGMTLATATVTIGSGDLTITATYKDAPKYTLTIVNGSGSGSYSEGEEITIEANIPAEGELFENWTGDVDILESTTKTVATFLMPTKNISITATYIKTTKPTYDLTIVNGKGSGKYQSGDMVIIVADDAPEGMEFYQWDGDIQFVENTLAISATVTMPAGSVELTAQYKEIELTAVDDVVSDILIYPIPATENITIENIEIFTKVSIIDMSGKVLNVLQPENVNKIELNISHLQKGLYVVIVESNNKGNTSQHIIVKQ